MLCYSIKYNFVHIGKQENHWSQNDAMPSWDTEQHIVQTPFINPIVWTRPSYQIWGTKHLSFDQKSIIQLKLLISNSPSVLIKVTQTLKNIK